MKRAAVPSILVVVVLLALGVTAEAQQTKKVPRIGAFVPASASGAPQLVEALRQGLREHGYVEEQNITLEPRYAEGNIERLAGLAAELVRLKVDVIVGGSTPGVIAAKNATGAIPIVMVTTGDPVAGGLVTSLARPGGQHHGADRSRARVKRETVGGAQGSRPQGLPGWPCSRIQRIQCGLSLKGVEVAARTLGVQFRVQ
jgi:ABC-type uncharacterized transport system substrate-binding protein